METGDIEHVRVQHIISKMVFVHFWSIFGYFK